ncbi:hypothetical protein ACU4GD_34830 [Cupriavidus basilensis]
MASPGGPIGALLPPANLSGVEPVMGDVPALGAHSAAILAELGYGAGRNRQDGGQQDDLSRRTRP